MSELEDLRKKIDALDKELLEVLARRMAVVQEVGRYKKARGLSLRDDERLKALMDERLRIASGLDLPEELVRKLYDLIHEASLKKEADA